jgi:hypothetical protein
MSAIFDYNSEGWILLPGAKGRLLRTVGPGAMYIIL